MIEQPLVTEASRRVADLPLGVVEVVIGAPDGEGRLRRRRRLAADQHHAIERLDALQVEHVAVAHRQQHVPRRPVGVQDARRLPVDRPDLEDPFEADRSDPRRPGAAGIAIQVVGGAHAFAAARVAEHAEVREIERAADVEAKARRRAAGRVPLAETLQVLEHQPPAPQVEPAIVGHAGGGVHAAIRVDRDDDVAPRREPLGEVGVARMTRHHDVPRRTGAGEGVLHVDVEAPRTGALEPSAGRVVAVQEHQQRIRGMREVERTIDARPQLGRELGGHVRIDRRRQLVFSARRRERSDAGGVGGNLRVRSRGQQDEAVSENGTRS